MFVRGRRRRGRVRACCGGAEERSGGREVRREPVEEESDESDERVQCPDAARIVGVVAIGRSCVIIWGVIFGR